MAEKKRIFSGIQPSGDLTLGSYMGAIKNWVALQDEYECVYCIVDMHAITVRQVPADLRRRSLEQLAQYIACGLDPQKNIMFIQSHVPQHAELSWVLGCYTQFGELSRMTQFKMKSQQHADNITAGLFTYPVLMAADILLYQTDLVPVGEDQRQHVELCRDIGARFNNSFPDTFKLPEAFIPKMGARIMSLGNPDNKMSKSDPDGCVFLMDKPEDIMRKFKRAVTDCETAVRFDKDNKPGISNLLTIYCAATGKSPEEAEEAFTTTAEIRKEMLDEDNPLYLGTLEALARVFVKQEAYEKAIELYQEKNDLNFEETPQEQMAAANNLLAIANCYRLSGVEEKAAAYFAEAEAKQKRSGLPMDETYEKRRGLYLRQKMEHAMPPKPKKGGDIRKELEYYSALALSIRNKEGEGQSFAKVLLKTAALHAKLGNQRDTETLLDRVLSIGAKEGIFTTSFGRLCDRVGRIYAEAGSKNKAEATLRQAYQIQTMTEKCMTGQGQALLLRLLQEKGDEKAYFAVKNAGKLE